MFTFAVTMVSLGAGLLVTFLGIPVLAAGLAGCRGFGALERARARGLLGLDVADAGAAADDASRARWPGWARCSRAARPGGHLLYSVLHLPWAVFVVRRSP